MAARRPRIKLKPKSKHCQLVAIPGKYGDNVIGTVCKDGAGYAYTSMPSTGTRRSAGSKKSAVLRVVKDYQRWIGLGPGKLTY